ncbi:U3 small nucleolar RNA-associated protein 4 homolog [Dendronephthya gigantea]|uniref:U3 small nucleolar RNA-associated protein 4 homolog n=1 Tax=Dendronephthya gigantea TaxID=151771 RepID=UPI00106B2580|nr:U3 small nucleolar RNA-associated protein 4 homolog [Dendronephthya gigantea]
MVRYKIHRVRFVPYMPQAIHCLAVEGKKKPRIAVSRADSSIEIWNIEDNWYLERKIPGCNESSVEALVWSKSRLFSSGLHGEITEWDLNRLDAKTCVDSYGGAVWSLAVNHEQTLMAAGCEDGCVRLFDITSEEIEYARVFSKQEGRILSLCWHKDGQILVAGGSDATIRVYEVSTGHARLCITLDTSSQRKALVWSLVVTNNFTIISGDSSGKTQFWDGKLGTLIKSFNVHTADVLAVCVNQQEDTVYASGVDNKLVQFRLVTDEEGSKTWSRSISTRAHTHDIRALAMIESVDQPFLVSGGVDTNILVYSTAKYGSDPRKIPAYPLTPAIHLASQSNILMFQKTTVLHLWRLGETVDEESCHLEKNPSYMLQIEAKSSNHIVCSALSGDGLWTGFSDVHHVSLFMLNLEDSSSLLVQQAKYLPEEILPAHHMKFTQDCSKLITITMKKSLQVIHLSNDSITVETVEFPISSSAIDYKDLDFYAPVTSLTVSSDGSLCASADTEGCVQVFDIHNTKHHNTLPRFSRQVTAMAFQPETNILALVTTNKEVFMFNIEKMKMTNWSKKASKNSLPQQWQGRHTKVVNILFDPYCKDIMLLQSHDMFVLLDTTKPLPPKSIKLFETKREKFKARVGRKRRHNGSDSEQQQIEQSEAFKVCKKYQPLLFLGVNEDKSLVIVERSWLSIMENLPPTLHRKRYGT